MFICRIEVRHVVYLTSTLAAVQLPCLPIFATVQDTWRSWSGCAGAIGASSPPTERAVNSGLLHSSLRLRRAGGDTRFSSVRLPVDA